MGGVGVGRRPFDAEEEGVGFGAGTAGGVHVDFAVQNAVYLEGVAVNKITGSSDGLLGDGAAGKLGVRVFKPG